MPSPPPALRPCRAAFCWLAYVLAFLIALYAEPTFRHRYPDAPLWVALLLTCSATTAVYCISFVSGNSSVYDPYWCLAPLHLCFAWKAQAPGGFWFYEPRETMCIVLLWAWALRFTSYPGGAN